MITYSLAQLQSIHARVAADEESNPSPAGQQRLNVLNDLTSRMIIFSQDNVDAESLDPVIATMLRLLHKHNSPVATQP